MLVLPGAVSYRPHSGGPLPWSKAKTPHRTRAPDGRSLPLVSDLSGAVREAPRVAGRAGPGRAEFTVLSAAPGLRRPRGSRRSGRHPI